MPSLLEFDKHQKEQTNNYEINIKELCCEYCLKNYIEELLLIDGIESAHSNFDNLDKKDVKIKITYNKNFINEEKIKK